MTWLAKNWPKFFREDHVSQKIHIQLKDTDKVKIILSIHENILLLFCAKIGVDLGSSVQAIGLRIIKS